MKKEIDIRALNRSLDELLDTDIQSAYDSRGRINSSVLADELGDLPRYRILLDALASAWTDSKFREKVQDRLHRAALDESQEQMTLIPGWRPLRLPGALVVNSQDGATLYVRRGDSVRADYTGARKLLRTQIRNDSNRLRILTMHDQRLETLRQKYGDLPERELIRLASEQDEPGSKQNEAHARS